MKSPSPNDNEIREFVDYLRDKAAGIKNAKNGEDIIFALYVSANSRNPSWRQLKRRLSALAVAALEVGHPICTGDVGYWYAVEPTDFLPTIALLRSRAVAMLERAQALTEFYDRLSTGQLPLPGINRES